ncbi:MAG: Holliday junction resolvase Hjc [archaeon]|nr:Holliday junction resolvase [Candidatus Micrarchaeota archaeon]
MAYYKKGANAERELLHILWEKGFAVVRIAGSGGTTLPAPDIVALSRKKRLAFECKAWNSAYLNIPLKQMDELIGWGKKAGANVFIAWKIPNKGWLFLPPKTFSKKASNYTISKKKAFSKAINLNVIVGEQSKLKL